MTRSIPFVCFCLLLWPACGLAAALSQRSYRVVRRRSSLLKSSRRAVPVPAAPSSDVNTAAVCDYGRGEWVADDARQPLYNPLQCARRLLDNKGACNYKSRQGFLRWRWQPQQPHCRLPHVTKAHISKALQGRHLLMVGDSLMEQTFHTLTCVLFKHLSARPERERWMGIGRRIAVHKIDFSVVYVRSNILCSDANCTGPDARWRDVLPLFNTAIFTSGRWWGQGHDYFPWQLQREAELVRYSSLDEGPPMRLQEVLDPRLYRALRLHQPQARRQRQPHARALAMLIDATAKFQGELIYQTVTPSHFQGGHFRNGTCDAYEAPWAPSEARWLCDFMRFHQNELDAFAQPPQSSRWRLLDVTHLSSLRPDAHPADHSVHQKAAKAAAAAPRAARWAARAKAKKKQAAAAAAAAAASALVADVQTGGERERRPVEAASVVPPRQQADDVSSIRSPLLRVFEWLSATSAKLAVAASSIGKRRDVGIAGGTAVVATDSAKAIGVAQDDEVGGKNVVEPAVAAAAAAARESGHSRSLSAATTAPRQGADERAASTRRTSATTVTHKKSVRDSGATAVQAAATALTAPPLVRPKRQRAQNASQKHLVGSLPDELRQDCAHFCLGTVPNAWLEILLVMLNSTSSSLPVMAKETSSISEGRDERWQRRPGGDDGRLDEGAEMSMRMAEVQDRF